MLQANQNFAVSFLKAPLSLPTGSAETITKSLEPFHKGQGRDLVLGAARTGFFTYSEPSCGRGFSSGPGISTQLVGAGLGAVPLVGGVLKTVFGAFGAHHATAVKNEQAALCQAVPDANNFLRGIDAALAQGQIDTATAVQALEQGYQNWLPEIAGIIQEHGDTCNAACIYRKAFRAAIEKRKLDYAIIDAQNATGAQNVLHGVVDSVGVAVSGAVSSIGSALGLSLPGSSGFGSALSPSGGGDALVQAGLTPARQTSLAMSIMVGGLVVVGLLWFQFIRGAKK